MQHRLNRFPIKPLRTLHGQHDRGLRITTFPRKGFATRQHKMHTRGAHTRQGRNTARQLAFHGAHTVHILLKGCGRQAFIAIKDFVANVTSRWQAFPRKRQPQTTHLVIRHHDPGAIAFDAIRNLGPIKRSDYLPGIALLQIGI